jgi:D-alanyl-D-alanine carboxypeptidase/D-alanyl-D-alanine-endopeptidase (penicillin-binding protein 4)
MKEAFNKKGIILEGNLIGVRQLPDTIRFNYTSKKNVCSHFGASVKEIAYWTNLKSINVFAETLNSWIGYEKTGLGTTENGVKSIQDYWKGKIYTDGLNLTDGSGLSRSNSVSARNFCSLLQYMYFSKNQEAFLSTLPVTGQSGTLTYFCKGQCSEGKIQAKSGTMKRVKSYAGYVSTTSGKKLTFALIVNNYNCSNTTIMKKMESLMNAMYLQ